ncbi:hypothetical protein NDU88_002621 [Pleurodeles waltl]|uniref:Uncharacterized protein n=1 Tax=Pleurodeles waltl TaxID=8319 RepID=A0AAV7L1R6_PLEWA|nr:hypothetical protein NDU88_002621 [Pleurodeles waltl]
MTIELKTSSQYREYSNPVWQVYCDDDDDAGGAVKKNMNKHVALQARLLFVIKEVLRYRHFEFCDQYQQDNSADVSGAKKRLVLRPKLVLGDNGCTQ